LLFIIFTIFISFKFHLFIALISTKFYIASVYIRFSLVSEKSNDVSKQLAVPNQPNKSTRTDTSRKTYLDNDYSLSPVVLETPREPVTIVDGFFTIGGI
jgi:hypothetical protein